LKEQKKPGGKKEGEEAKGLEKPPLLGDKKEKDSNRGKSQGRTLPRGWGGAWGERNEKPISAGSSAEKL